MSKRHLHLLVMNPSHPGHFIYTGPLISSCLFSVWKMKEWMNPDLYAIISPGFLTWQGLSGLMLSHWSHVPSISAIIIHSSSFWHLPHPKTYNLLSIFDSWKHSARRYLHGMFIKATIPGKLGISAPSNGMLFHCHMHLH